MDINEYDHLNKDDRDQIRELTKDELARRLINQNRGFRRTLAALVREVRRDPGHLADCDIQAAEAIDKYYRDLGNVPSR